jgi:thymidylate synthase (FAD)
MIGDKIDVLDHGLVRLVDAMGSDLSVVRAARVSYDAAWRAGEDQGSDARLINYLWKNHHTSPFEAVTFTFEVKAPIFVFRQWHRHRTWSFNELSARYRELPEEYYVPNPEYVGIQSKDNKQAREIVQLTEEELAYQDKMVGFYKSRCKADFEAYHKLLKAGWPRELARMVLPLSTYSHMFASVDLLNLLKFISLRDHAHAQYEVQVYARAMLELITPIVPASVEAFSKGRS